MNTNDFHGSFISYVDMMKYFFEFEDLLKQYKIKIEFDNDLERVGLSIIALNDFYKGIHEIKEANDIRSFMEELIGGYSIISKIVKVKDHINFINLIPHIKLLNKSRFFQNTKSVIYDRTLGSYINNQNSNKVFELFIASLIMEFSDSMELDDPNRSQGTNPDVMFNLGRKKYGIACKVINSDSIKSKTMLDNFEEGVRQIENSQCERGYVFINLKNIIPHREIFPIINQDEFINGEIPIFGAYLSNDNPKHKLQEIANAYQKEIQSNWNDSFLEITGNKKVMPGIVLFMQTTIARSINGISYPTLFGFFSILSIREIISECTKEDYCLLEKINRIMQSL